MTLKHTPGPWSNDGNTISGFVDRDMAPHYLAPVCYIDSDWCEPVQAANARLISAAPDLLAALQELIAELDNREPPQGHIFRDTGGMILAREAIAKATGE